MDLLELFSARGLAPHGYCLLWQPGLLWLHILSDAVIGCAYFSIPVALMVLIRKRQDIEFSWMVVLFALFIVACGTTHFLSILVLWVPVYGIEGLIKAITALTSLATAVLLWPLLPKLLAIPSPSQLQVANAELRLQVLERERVEAELSQARRLEAIGRLTAGIAHDFNNLLTVVIGGVERAMRHAGDRERYSTALGRALTASQRAATLVDQLLTFGRRKPVQVGEHDLNAVVTGLAPLLAPMVGDAVTITFDTAPEPLVVEIDKAVLETAIFNLASNAAHAMDGRGTLRIATRQEAGGPNGEKTASLIVADTGRGMDAETLARATEPFFTTKGIGEGTGLGLSQVHGFISQSGGSLAIRSHPGRGTAVTLSIPLCAAGPPGGSG